MNIWRYLLLVFVGLLLYLPSLPNKFVWDDEEQVVANTAVHSLSQLPAIFSGSTFNSGGSERLGGLYYKPLMSASFAVIYTVFGASPWAFHLLQISLHIGTTLLLFIILQKLWEKEWASLTAALLFLIHPQNVETVVYISSLQDTLYMFFGMLGLTWIVISEGKLKIGDFLVAGVCVFLAMLSKETGVLFSVVTATYIRFFGKRWDFAKWLIMLVFIVGAYLYLRIGVAGVGLEKNMFTPMATLPLLDRIGNISGIVWHYLSQFMWPARLAISQHWVNRSPWIVEWVGLFGLVAAWIGVLWNRWIYKEWIFVMFWIWFGVAMAFHSQIFPLDMTVADRWFYLPMIGLVGSVGSLESIKSVKFVKLGAIVILAALFVRSSVRIQNWRDGLTLYSHDAQIMQNSFDLENNLGVELYRVDQMSDAKEHFTKSTMISPTWWTNWNNLGVVVEDEGELDIALSHYKKAIDNGNYYLAYGNYGRVLIKQKKFVEAKNFVQNSLKLYPTNSTLLELYRYLSILENK
jgi:hypothetical protein